MVEAQCSTGGGISPTNPGTVYAQAFTEPSTGGKKILVVNKGSTPTRVTYLGASGKSWTFIDESTAYGPAQTVALSSDTWTLAPFALGILRV